MQMYLNREGDRGSLEKGRTIKELLLGSEARVGPQYFWLKQQLKSGFECYLLDSL